jgi:hypothetical protein
MSYSQLVIFKNNIAEPYEEFSNGSGTGWRVWYALSNKYSNGIPWLFWVENHLFRNWNTLPEEFEKIVLLWTCDYSVTKREYFPNLIAALRKFVEVYPTTGVCHLGKIADIIESLDETVEAVALHASSCNDWYWGVYDTKRRPYDLSKDKKHWFVHELINEGKNERK